MMTRTRNIALVSAFVLTDQLSKYIIRNYSGFYICNPNIAFGIPFAYFFIFISCVIFLLIFTNLKLKNFNLKSISNFLPTGQAGKFQISNYSTLQAIGLILIISGGISNILDRVSFGCVIDFINLKIWPVFNLADIYITIGAMMIIIKHMTYSIKQKKN